MSGGSLIKSISTQQIVGEDLAGTYDFVDDVYISVNTGNEVTYQGWSSTDYVDISKYSSVYGDGDKYAAFYDENKTFITAVNISDFTKPANAKYVRFSNNTSSIRNGHIIGLF